MIVFLIIIGLFSLILLFWQFSNMLSVLAGSPYVKTDKLVIRQALGLVKIKKGEIFYELGSGNGDVLIEAAKLGAKAYGFEISPFYFWWSKFRTRKFRNIRIKQQSFLKADFSKVDVAYCYLLPELLKSLSTKFESMKKGSKIVSIGFPIKQTKRLKTSRYIINKRSIFISSR